jgi:hypothetical protein
LPFSSESRYALESYLDLHGLGALNKDADLMTMLSQSQSNDGDGVNEGEDKTTHDTFAKHYTYIHNMFQC